MKASATSPRSSSTKLDWPVFGVSGGLIFLFMVASLIDIKMVAGVVDVAFAFSVKYFGPFWQLLLLATFFVAIGLAFSRYGRVRLGGIDQPEMSTFRWIAIIMCTLLAAGGVFWSFAEPMYHFTDVPPSFPGVEAGTAAAVGPALAQSHHHWGFLSWAIIGTLGSIVAMYTHYHRGLPLKPRSLLYPVLGERAMHGWIGTAVDASSILAVAAGTIGPIGFLGLQLSYSLDKLVGIPDVYATQLTIVAGLVAIYTISAVTGIDRGIQILSRFNVLLALALLVIIIFTGPGSFIIDSFFTSFGLYLNNFFTISTNRSDPAWLGSWSIFFGGWFLGYGPLTAMFVARISRGRTVREILIAMAIVAPIATNFWFTILGGSGIYYELAQPGVISGPLAEGGLPATMLAVVQQLPLAGLLVPAFLVLIVVFLATTGDSMSFTIAMAVSGNDTPATWVRVFWAVTMGAVAAILLRLGDGGITALQSFIVVTAVPVSLVLLPLLWSAPRVVAELGRDQGLAPAGEEARAPAD
jgi:glycine betaine transporter